MNATTFDDVLIVVPCLNEGAHLPALLAQFVREAPGARIVVADGGSSDASVAVVNAWTSRHPAIVLIDNPDRIQSCGVMRAVRRFGAGYRWLIRLDAHCGYPDGYVGGLLTAARAHDAASVVVPLRTLGRECFQRAVAAAQNSRLGNGGSPHRLIVTGRLVDHGHHALMRLDLFAAVGGYCERMSHNEDAELDHRLARAGGRIWLEPTLAIDYWPRRDPVALFRQYVGYGSGRARTVMRHRLPLKPRQLAPLMVVPVLVAALSAPLFGWWLALPAFSWAALSLGYGVVLGVRGRYRCEMAAGAAAMTMHAGWSLGFLRQRLVGRHPGPPPTPFDPAIAA